LYLFTSQLQVSLDNTPLPDAYTARNISITVRTILLGISWLATFVFAANSLGLLGEHVPRPYVCSSVTQHLVPSIFTAPCCSLLTK
jgi:hypothetical protein